LPSDPETRTSRRAENADEQQADRAGLRRYGRWIVAGLAAFGILGAIGHKAVDWSVSTAGEKIHKTKPLLIGVREDPQGGSDGFVVAARSPAGLDQKLRGAHDCDSLMTISKAAGATDYYKVTERLVLEGGTRRDVSIVDMRAKVLTRETPLRGAKISCGSAGAVGGIGILFKLDEPHPVALKLTDGAALTTAGPYFANGNIINLTKGETQGFEIVGQSTSSYVEWQIDADVVIDGKSKTITINNDGQPFRVTGLPSENRRYQRYYEFQWWKRPPRMYKGSKPPPL
jgi:hypothetical protein